MLNVSYKPGHVTVIPYTEGVLPPPLKLTATIWLKVALNPIQSTNQSNITLLGIYRFIYFSHFCLMLNKQNIGLPFCNYNRGGIVCVLQTKTKTETPFKVYT